MDYISPPINAAAQSVLDFIAKSPSCFHAVRAAEQCLRAGGFERLHEEEAWRVLPGHAYYVIRNNSSIISFFVPEKMFPAFRMCASHCDSPAFKVKERPEIKAGRSCTTINVEKYGGTLPAHWFDRPLSVAGRVVLRSQADSLRFEERLFNVDRDLLLIPSLAIHLTRDAAREKDISVQNEMLPVLSCGDGEVLLADIIAQYADVPRGDILGSDIFLYDRAAGTFWGARNEFVAAPRIDDLAGAYTSLLGFMDACRDNTRCASVHCMFDNEEVGSLTRQGADSTFLHDVLVRLNHALGRSMEDYYTAIARSFLLSVDGAHAAHPNYAAKADPVNRPVMNGGPVIKFSAAQKYTSDGIGAAMFRAVCERAGVPHQVFTNHSDIAGGATLGNISNAHVSVRAVDVGLPQWAMHSPCESAGALDMEYMREAVAAFYAYSEG